ncbi:MAG: hypothetical protein FWE04_03360 [Oscillospiraceae bacterium]|nr:hypothetical protein [Oscillospiraceae bacterium]
MKTITVEELKQTKVGEGLVLQGCGGDPQEWLDGFNEMLTSEKILLEGDKFKEISVFEHGGNTNILFSMDDVKLDVGKLAMWRLQSHSTFGGTWLSDYLPNKLGVELGTTAEQSNENLKPDCPIIGANSNIFNLMGIVSKTLKRDGQSEAAKEMSERVMDSGSFDEALGIMTEYVNPVDVNMPDFDMEMKGM